MRAGFSLIYIRCGEYFDQKGSHQANANLLRDSIAPIAAVISGVMALHSYKSANNAEKDLKWLALGTSSAIAGLDVYTEHYLFGAENVNAVKSLMLEELATHSGKALTLDPANMEEAALQIYDNQDICTPAHIATSVRGAITKGTFSAAISGAAGVGQSKVFLGKLGAVLSLTPPIITDTQAGLLWAITTGKARQQAQLHLIRDKLSDLPEAANPVEINGGIYSAKAGYPYDRLQAAFSELPSEAQAYLDVQSARLMADAAQAGLADTNARVAGIVGHSAVDALISSPASNFQIPAEQNGGLRRVKLEAK